MAAASTPDGTSDKAHDAVLTLDEPSASQRGKHAAEPALVAIFADGRPVMRVFPLHGGRLEIGRSADGLPDDLLASRRHAEVRLVAGTWVITDLGSRNGTHVNGVRLGTAALEVPSGQRLVLRMGGRLYLVCEDATDFRSHGVRKRDDMVIGPTLAAALERVREAGRTGENLLVLGESGAGKELAARTYHAAGSRADAPFVAVNCAAIPEGLAERLLFGSTRGAYSGATDAVGHIQAAHGGTLFLDEVGELAPAVQAKLLRVLESREVTPLGASRAQAVAVRFCFATLRHLRLLVAEQGFRADLFFRIARTTVTLPPLRQRVEEIPWLIAGALGALDAKLVAHASLAEACALAEWPGNVRELLTSVRHAAGAAQRSGTTTVRAAHLPIDIPIAVMRAGATTAERPPGSDTLDPGSLPEDISAEQLRAAVEAQRGNLAAAARALGVNRSTLYRLLERHGIARPPRHG